MVHTSHNGALTQVISLAIIGQTISQGTIYFPFVQVSTYESRNGALTQVISPAIVGQTASKGTIYSFHAVFNVRPRHSEQFILNASKHRWASTDRSQPCDTRLITPTIQIVLYTRWLRHCTLPGDIQSPCHTEPILGMYSPAMSPRCLRR